MDWRKFVNSTEHSEMFSKKTAIIIDCNVCYQKFGKPEEVAKHKEEQHSPNSFYEKLVDEMSGRCSVCKKTFGIKDIEDHIKIEHDPTGGRGIVSIKIKSN